jgi:N-acyl-D-amino-acid deacylase
MLDLALEEDLATVFSALLLNSDEAAVAKMLRHPASLVSLSDAGAHLTFFNDAGYGLHLLGHWVRGLRALTLGEAARRLTSDPATVDRGPKRRVFDLPGGHARLTTAALGVKGVWVNGVRLEGEARPGRLLRDFSS